MRLLIPLLLLLAATTANAQYCNPASVSLLLHNKDGTALTEAELKSIAGSLPKEIGDAKVWVGEASLAPDNKSFYWEESTEYANGKKVPALMFSNSSTCTMKLTEVTIDFGGRKMRLVFNIDIARSTEDRRPVIYAPNFQNSTFQLNLTGWSHDPNTIIPADRWKRSKD